MIARNSIIITVLAVISLALGVLRDRLITHYVADPALLDVYMASFRVPDFVYGIMLSFVTASTVVPYFIKDAEHPHHEPRKKLSSISLFYIGMMGVFAIIISTFMPLIADTLVSSFTEDQKSMFILASRIMLLQPIFLGLSSLISCFAQVKNEFLLLGISPLVYTLTSIVGIVFFYEKYGFIALIWSVVIGAALSLCVQSFSLRRARFSEVVFHFNRLHIKSLLSVALPRSGTNIAFQIGNLGVTSVATALGPGVFTAYMFASKLGEAVMQVVQQGVSTASLPVLSHAYSEGRYKDHKALVKKYTTLLGIFGIGSASLVYSFKSQLVELFYGVNPFNDTILILLGAFMIILPIRMMGAYLITTFYSMSKTKTIFFTALSGQAAMLFVVYFFHKSLGVMSLFWGIITWPLVSFVLLVTIYTGNIYIKKQVRP